MTPLVSKMVRGHWRIHPSGKKVWVKECKVGNAAHGAVFKDYKIEGTP